LQNHFQKFVDHGAALVALCPQRQTFNRIAAEELELSFPVLQDQDNEIATAFGLTLETPPEVIEAERTLGLDLPETNGTSNWDLPMPARYVIDLSGVIRFAAVHADHRLRSEPESCFTSMSVGHVGK
jgi:peroxiredoxin